jgi:hypothetical protein
VHAIGRTARTAIVRNAVSEGMQKYVARSLEELGRDFGRRSPARRQPTAVGR